MKRLKLFLLIFLFPVATLFAQGDQVSGTVSGTDGTPLPGASIRIKGTASGVITDINGAYSLSVSGLTDPVLLISFVGMKTVEETVGERRVIDVVLESDAIAVDEVIFVGYGTQKKSVVTASIARVTEEELGKTQAVRIESALQGRTAGVMISKSSGSPGSGLEVRIRGVNSNNNSSPVYVVDGMMTGGIDYLNPNDIESVEVLKDASAAAIYGAQGGNGVVLITTKKGKAGTAKISYSATFGKQEIVSDFSLLDADQYLAYYTTALPNLTNKFQTEYDRGYDTDWLGAVMSAAPMQKHDLSFSGGDDKSSYYFSGSYLKQDGTIGGEASSYERYTFNSDSQRKLNKWFKVGTKLSYTHKINRGISENTVYGSVLINSLILDPLTPVYYNSVDDIPASIVGNIVTYVGDDWQNSTIQGNENGFYGISNLISGEIFNPVAQLNNSNYKWMEDKMIGGVYADMQIFKDLKFHSTLNLDMAYATASDWKGTYYFATLQHNSISYVYKNDYRYYTWQNENYLDYEKTIGYHHIQALLGNTVRDYTYSYKGGLARSLVNESDIWAYFNTLTDTLDEVSEDFAEERLSSFYGRFNYDYNQLIMASATLRADGSSKFGSDNRFGYFPSFSLGWNVDRMDFWTFEEINRFKLRSSWGQNGSLSSLGNFQYISTINQTSYFYLDADENTIPTAEPDQISNSTLKWETTQQFDIGFDLAFLQNRITLTADYYNKTTKDLLMRGQFPDYLGNDMPWVNAGDVSNKGVELELGARSSFGELSGNFTLSAAYNKNTVVSLGGGEIIEGGYWGGYGNIQRFEEGYPAWYFYGYKTDGIFNSQEEIDNYVDANGNQIQPDAEPGDVRIVNIDTTNARITADDRTYLGNPYPDWTFGFSLNLEWKGFDFNMFWQGCVGNEIAYTAFRTDRDYGNLPSWWAENAWTEDNLSQEWYGISTKGSSDYNYIFNDYYVFDGSYLRLKNLTIGYTLPSKISEKIMVSRFRIYGSAENLITFTSYPGMDPEIGGGVDYGFYAGARVLYLGVNLEF